MNHQSPVRIAIVDDENLPRFAIANFLKPTEFEVSQVATNGKEFIDQLRQTTKPPAICILDIGMPVMNGYETMKELKKNWPYIKVLAHSIHCKPFCIHTMIHLGVNGFISKSEPNETILAALKTILLQDYYYSDLAPQTLFKKIKLSKQIKPLTTKENELLVHLYMGLTAKQIASAMNTTEGTIKSYKTSLYEKLELHSISDLMRFSVENELIY